MLTCALFSGDRQLQACAISHAAHVKLGARGTHVSRVHVALTLLGHGPIDPGEWREGCFGASTAAAVLAYKRSRAIVNRAYQQQPDEIVGVMTICSLDTELSGLMRAGPPGPSLRAIGSGLDSAAVFEAKRSAQGLAGSLRSRAAFDTFSGARGVFASLNPPDLAAAARVIRAFKDSAGEFAALTRLLFAAAGQCSPDPQWVEPAPGLDRDRIYRTAYTSQVDVPFHSAAVQGCWQVVEGGGKAPNPMPYHWCGIYAADIWRRSGFPNVRWRAVAQKDHLQGIFNNGVKVRSSRDFGMLAPGDIIVNNAVARDANGKPKLDDNGNPVHFYHHMLVLTISTDRRFIDIQQGNSGPYPPESSLVTRVRPLALQAKEHEFISVDTLRDPNVRYG
jgi:hypothetical protein